MAAVANTTDDPRVVKQFRYQEDIRTWIGPKHRDTLPPTSVGANMESVTGIGGVFFRARDPASLGLCYQKHLGIALTPSNHDEPPWWQAAGPTVFGPFPETTTYFGEAKQVWMINFRVRNLDLMVAQLEAAEIAVKVDPEQYLNGRFARLHDPEGNPIELWEPVARDLSR
jgi:glyoxylase I family protein